MSSSGVHLLTLVLLLHLQEWSDYADSLVSEKATLQLKVDELMARDADLKSVQLELEAVRAELGEAQSDRGALGIELDAVQALLLGSGWS